MPNDTISPIDNYGNEITSNAYSRMKEPHAQLSLAQEDIISPLRELPLRNHTHSWSSNKSPSSPSPLAKHLSRYECPQHKN